MDRPYTIYSCVATTRDIVTGQSVCNERVLVGLERAGFIVENGFVGIRGDANLVKKLFGRLRLLAHGLVWFARVPRGSIVYLIPPHGLGVFYVVPLVMVGRARGSRFVFHHHATNYLTQRSVMHGLLFRTAGSGTFHIVLCGCMRDALSRLYASCRDVHVLSNALFFGESEERKVEVARPLGDPIRLGFLSNIWPAKGIYEFLDLAAALPRRGIPCEALVAGPILPGPHAERIRARMESQPNVRYLGPIYDPDEKKQFYKDIDVFVFPTKTEAEPLVIYEAFSAATPVIAYERGCISDQVTGAAGIVVPHDAPFVERASEAIAKWHAEPESYLAARRAALHALRMKRQEAQEQWRALVQRLKGLAEEAPPRNDLY